MELLNAHHDGKPGVFAELVKRHRPRLWWAVRTSGIAPRHHMDAYQEGLLRIHRYSHTYSGVGSDAEACEGEASLGTWMTTVMRNTAKTYVQRSRRHIEAGETEFTEVARTLPCPRHRVESAVDRLDVYAGLRQLTVELRVVLALAAIHGMRDGEIAAELGIPVGTVKSRKARARRELKALLEGSGRSPLAAVPRCCAASP